MTEDLDLLEHVREALRADMRIGFDDSTIALTLTNGDLLIEGEVGDVAAKRRALREAARVVAGRFIVDRLHVRPAIRMQDGAIRDHLRDALLQEPALSPCRLREYVKGDLQPVRDPPDAAGTIDIRVEDGVVTLDGEVPGLERKRLAGLLAWWVPGSRDVINGIGVIPSEADSDFEIADAVRLALEKDPFVNAAELRVGVRNAVVALDGIVPSESERDMAEHDAWYVFGVEDVINRIAVER